MIKQIIQDWTGSEVHLSYSSIRYVKYRVYKQGHKVYQEIVDIDGVEIHILVLPDGLALERSSFEVMLRYVLVDVVNA